MNYLIVLVGCAVGCGLSLICGFGFGVFCMMFLPYVMGSTMGAASLINIVTLAQAIWLSLRYRKHIQWKLLAVPIAMYFVTSTLTVHYAAGLQNDVLRMMLGGFLLALSLYFMFAAKRIRIRKSVRNGMIAGGIGGIMSGLFSIGGPPVSLYFSAATEEKEEYLATIQGYYVLSNLYVIFLRAQKGYITQEVLIYAAVGLCGMALGTVLGNTVFQRINANTMRKAIYAMMALSGIVMLLK
jgi:hypothetical protein